MVLYNRYWSIPMLEMNFIPHLDRKTGVSGVRGVPRRSARLGRGRGSARAWTLQKAWGEPLTFWRFQLRIQENLGWLEWIEMDWNRFNWMEMIEMIRLHTPPLIFGSSNGWDPNELVPHVSDYDDYCQYWSWRKYIETSLGTWTNYPLQWKVSVCSPKSATIHVYSGFTEPTHSTTKQECRRFFRGCSVLKKGLKGFKPNNDVLGMFFSFK